MYGCVSYLYGEVYDITEKYIPLKKKDIFYW